MEHDLQSIPDCALITSSSDSIPALLKFKSDLETTGMLLYDNGKFRFEGDAEASAKVLFDAMIRNLGVYLQDNAQLVFEQTKAQALALILAQLPPDKQSEVHGAVMQVHWAVAAGLSLPKESDRVDHPYDATESGPWIIASWPDGTWCNWIERHQYANMSDDYEKLEVLSYDEGYCPVRTRPYVNPETKP